MTAIPVVNIPFTEGNPYQRLMYAAPDQRYRLITAPRGGLSAIAARVAEHPVIHLHWDDRVFGRSDDVAANRARADQVLGDMAAYRTAGGRILWTIHNRAPHKARDVETLADFRRRFCQIAHIVHVHAPHAAAHMAETYDCPPEKMRIIRHPSYLGAYEPEETTLTRPLPAGARAFLFFGMLRGQKGIAALANAAERLHGRRQDWTLRVIGKSFASQASMIERLTALEGVSHFGHRLPDEEVAGTFAGAQVFMAPYRDLFTSGSLALALTFGLPVIGPNVPEMRQATPSACHDLLYDGVRPRFLVQKMQEVVGMDRDALAEKRAACLDYARQTAPEVISAALFDAIDQARAAEG